MHIGLENLVLKADYKYDWVSKEYDWVSKEYPEKTKAIEKQSAGSLRSWKVGKSFGNKMTLVLQFWRNHEEIFTNFYFKSGSSCCLTSSFPSFDFREEHLIQQQESIQALHRSASPQRRRGETLEDELRGQTGPRWVSPFESFEIQTSWTEGLKAMMSGVAAAVTSQVL